jgi:MFS family permease
LGQQAGFAETVTLALFAVWLFFLGFFLVIEWRSSQPMIDLSLFQNRLFSINLLTGFLTFVCIAGTIILMPFYLENVLGYDPRAVGLLLAIVPIAMGLTAPVSGSLSDRLGTRPIAVAGLLVLLVGYYAISTLSVGTTPLGYILRFLPIGIGMGIFNSPNNSAIMGSAPRAQLGVASGLLAETRTLGQIIGIAVLGALWASRVAHYLGNVPQGGATAAPAPTQVAALQDTFYAVVVLIGLALLLGIWGLAQERRGQRMPEWAISPSQRQ